MAGIYKSYDVRGIVPKELTTGDAYRIGKATARVLKARTLAVGRDARTMGPDMSAALMAGITSAGCNVLDLGMGPTPLSYFAAGTLGAKKVQGAIQVTASHNPPQYCGFKFTKAGALPMSYDTGIADVEKLVAEDQPGLAKKPGRVRKVNLRAAYVRCVRRFAALDPKRPLRIAIDTGNGVTGAWLPDLLRGLPLHVTPLFWEPDGRFPNHEPNPLELHNLAALRQAVKDCDCDLGAAFDGDGDRVAFVDEKGEPIAGDLAGALMAKVLLERAGGGTVLYDVRATKAVADLIRECGGTPIETRVGHSHIKAGLREKNAIMGLELSGHYYFRDFFCSDCGEIAFFLMLSLLSRSGKPLSELAGSLRRYHHSGEVNFTVGSPAETLAALEARYAPQAVAIRKVDGLTVELDGWWFNLRPSNTEPKVRLAVESLASQEQMAAKVAEVSAAIKGAKP